MAAFHLLVREGWRPTPELERMGNTKPRPGVTLVGAVMSSGHMESGVDCWYARCILGRMERPLLQWERHPYRTRDCVLQLIRRALSAVGWEDVPGIPPEVRERRRGGWRVGAA